VGLVREQAETGVAADAEWLAAPAVGREII
jgi:hypothetical protein